MASEPGVLTGIIHGKTIELEVEPGLPDGQRVRVTVAAASAQETGADSALQALQRAAGTWVDDPEGLDQFLEWNRQQRKVSRRELPE